MLQQKTLFFVCGKMIKRQIKAVCLQLKKGKIDCPAATWPGMNPPVKLGERIEDDVLLTEKRCEVLS